jgi:hypothetical protein
MTITFNGPFSWLPRLVWAPWVDTHKNFDLHDTPWLHEQASASEPGVYLWTVRAGFECVVDHVGYSETSIAGALWQHLTAFFRGEYVVYDIESFRDFRKNPVYVPTGNPADFRRNFQYIYNDLLGMLCEYEIFYAVCREDRRTLEAIKSALIMRLLDDPLGAGAFLDNPPPLASDESPIALTVRTAPGVLLFGL